MQFSLTEDQALIAESARDWLSGHYDFRSREAGVHCDGGARAAWTAWAELGWLALPLPAHCGGIEGGPLESGLLMQAMGRHLTVEPYLNGVLQATCLLALAGTPAQQDKWLSMAASGRVRLAFAHDEPHMQTPWDAPKCSVRREGGRWVLDGLKSSVEGASGAAALLVSALDEATGGLRAVVVVPAETSGVRLEVHDTTDGARAADLHFDSVILDESAFLVGQAEDLPALLDRVLAEGIVARSWQVTGAMQASMEQTAQYTRERHQFGKALADFQVIQHRLAEMLVQCTEAQAVCELAAMRLSRSDDVRAIASTARSKVARAARFVAEQCVQLHGAMGVCEELPIASAFRTMLAYCGRDGREKLHAQRLGEHVLLHSAYEQSVTLGAAA